MLKQRYKNAWAAIEDMSGDAANMKARAELMYTITEYDRRRNHVRTNNPTQ